LAGEVRRVLKHVLPRGEPTLPEPKLHLHWCPPAPVCWRVVVTCVRPAVTVRCPPEKGGNPHGQVAGNYKKHTMLTFLPSIKDVNSRSEITR
jgi:hypothetical protein